MKQCPTFLVYNEVHYHIPSVVTFSNGKINKQPKMTDTSSGDRFWDRDYIIREREGRKELVRKNILHRLFCISYLYYVILPKNIAGRGIIEQLFPLSKTDMNG